MRPIISTKNVKQSAGCTTEVGSFGSTYNLGGFFGSGTENSNSWMSISNRSIFFRDRVYSLHDGAVWGFSEATNSWEKSLQVSTYDRTTLGGHSTGMYYFLDGTRTGKLGFFIEEVGGGWMQYTFDGSSWTHKKVYGRVDSDNANNLFYTGDDGFDELAFNGRIISRAGQPSNHFYFGGLYVSFDLMTGNNIGSAPDTSQIDWGFNANVFLAKNSLFFVRETLSRDALYLYEMISSKPIFRGINLAQTLPDTSNHTTWKSWSDGSSLYTLYRQSSQGWKLLKFDVDANKTLTDMQDITSQTLPSTFPGNENAWFKPIWDHHEDPSNPQFFLAVGKTSDTSGPLQWFRWNGPTGLMTLEGAGHGFYNSMPKNCINGGERTYVSGRVNVQIEDYGPGSELYTTKFYFRLYPSTLVPSSTSAQVFFLRPSGTNDIPRSRCSLKRPSHGSIVNGHTMTGITMDSGTLYSVEWDGLTDNVSLDFFGTIIPVVSGV